MKPKIVFDRLFTISAFEGLRLLRLLMAELPEYPADHLVDVIERRWPASTSYDLEAAIALDGMVRAGAPSNSVEFYRECVQAVMYQEMPSWARLMTIGRGRFLKSIAKDKYRDIRSVFREARLLDEPPTDEDIAWWDAMKERVRSNRSLDAMERARRAEKLTLTFEVTKLAEANVDRSPTWVAIEDDTVGYDILSYELISSGIRPLQIEVKSTIASPLRFNVSRNEWEQANSVGEAYRFHIWNLERTPPVMFERTVDEVRPHIPDDNDQGTWTNVRIPVGIPADAAPIDADWEAL